MPKTMFGKLSVILVTLTPFLIAAGRISLGLYENIPSGETILEDISDRPILALLMLSGIASGIAAFFSGITAILRYKDRTLVVYVSTAIGSLMLLLVIGEVAFPH